MKRVLPKECIYETEIDSDIENRLVVAKGWWVGKGWTGSLGLADANCYITEWVNNRSDCRA